MFVCLFVCFLSSFLSTTATSARAFKTSYPSLLHKSILINPISSYPICLPLSLLFTVTIIIFLTAFSFLAILHYLFIIYLIFNKFRLPHLIFVNITERPTHNKQNAYFLLGFFCLPLTYRHQILDEII